MYKNETLFRDLHRETFGRETRVFVIVFPIKQQHIYVFLSKSFPVKIQTFFQHIKQQI